MRYNILFANIRVILLCKNDTIFHGRNVERDWVVAQITFIVTTTYINV